MEKQHAKQNSTEENQITINDTNNNFNNNLMIIDDERQNEIQKVTSTVFIDINSIQVEAEPEQITNTNNNINNLLTNQESQESKSENTFNINNNDTSKENTTNNNQKQNYYLGVKRTFEKFSSQANWENPMANRSDNNINNIAKLANTNFNQSASFAAASLNNNVIINSNNNMLNTNVLGFSVNQNPFVPKKLNQSINTDSLYSTEANNTHQNNNNRKAIPFQNNFNVLLTSNNNTVLKSSAASADTNSIFPSNVMSINANNPMQSNNVSDRHTQNQNQIPATSSGNITYYNQNSLGGVVGVAATTQGLPLPSSISGLQSFGSYNNSFLGITNNLAFNNAKEKEKDAFSKAIINNKIYTEDKNDFIQVGQQQTKKANYREGLFDKAEENSSSYNKIPKNNYAKIASFSASSANVSLTQNQNRGGAGVLMTKNDAGASEADENKENTDDDQEEIKIIEEILQSYLDEGKVINDKKLKISVIRKVAPHYKVLSQQNNDWHFADTVDKIKTIINEDSANIIMLLNYEYLKTLREKVFQKFCKMINKFFFKLNENKVKDFGGENYNNEIPEVLKERLKNIFTKINDYFEKNKELE